MHFRETSSCLPMLCRLEYPRFKKHYFTGMTRLFLAVHLRFQWSSKWIVQEDWITFNKLSWLLFSYLERHKNPNVKYNWNCLENLHISVACSDFQQFTTNRSDIECLSDIFDLKANLSDSDPIKITSSSFYSHQISPTDYVFENQSDR